MAGVTFKIKQFVPNNDLYQVEEVDKTYNSLADLVNELSVNLIEISKLNNKRNGFLTKLKKINPFKNNDQQNLNNLVSDLEYYIRWYNYAQMVKQDVQVFSPENNILISTFNQHRAKFNELSSRAGNDISKKIDLINNKIETLSQQIALNSIVLARTNKLTSRVAGQEWFINPVFDTTDTAPRTPATTTAPRTPAPVTTPTPAPAPAPTPTATEQQTYQTILKALVNYKNNPSTDNLNALQASGNSFKDHANPFLVRICTKVSDYTQNQSIHELTDSINLNFYIACQADILELYNKLNLVDDQKKGFWQDPMEKIPEIKKYTDILYQPWIITYQDFINELKKANNPSNLSLTNPVADGNENKISTETLYNCLFVKLSVLELENQPYITEILDALVGIKDENFKIEDLENYQDYKNLQLYFSLAQDEIACKFYEVNKGFSNLNSKKLEEFQELWDEYNKLYKEKHFEYRQQVQNLGKTEAEISTALNQNIEIKRLQDGLINFLGFPTGTNFEEAVKIKKEEKKLKNLIEQESQNYFLPEKKRENIKKLEQFTVPKQYTILDEFWNSSYTEYLQKNPLTEEQQIENEITKNLKLLEKFQQDEKFDIYVLKKTWIELKTLYKKTENNEQANLCEYVIKEINTINNILVDIGGEKIKKIKEIKEVSEQGLFLLNQRENLKISLELDKFIGNLFQNKTLNTATRQTLAFYKTKLKEQDTVYAKYQLILLNTLENRPSLFGDKNFKAAFLEINKLSQNPIAVILAELNFLGEQLENPAQLSEQQKENIKKQIDTYFVGLQKYQLNENKKITDLIEKFNNFKKLKLTNPVYLENQQNLFKQIKTTYQTYFGDVENNPYFQKLLNSNVKALSSTAIITVSEQPKALTDFIATVDTFGLRTQPKVLTVYKGAVTQTKPTKTPKKPSLFSRFINKVQGRQLLQEESDQATIQASNSKIKNTEIAATFLTQEALFKRLEDLRKGGNKHTAQDLKNEIKYTENLLKKHPKAKYIKTYYDLLHKELDELKNKIHQPSTIEQNAESWCYDTITRPNSINNTNDISLAADRAAELKKYHISDISDTLEVNNETYSVILDELKNKALENNQKINNFRKEFREVAQGIKKTSKKELENDHFGAIQALYLEEFDDLIIKAMQLLSHPEQYSLQQMIDLQVDIAYRFDHFNHYKERLELKDDHPKYITLNTLKDQIKGELIEKFKENIQDFKTIEIPELSLEVFKSNLEYKFIVMFITSKLQAFLNSSTVEGIENLERTITQAELLIKVENVEKSNVTEGLKTNLANAIKDAKDILDKLKPQSKVERGSEIPNISSSLDALKRRGKNPQTTQMVEKTTKSSLTGGGKPRT